MEPEPSAPVRQRRFQPKIPTRKPKKPAVPKVEAKDEPDAAQTRELLRRVNEAAVRGRPKVENKAAPVQVAFGEGGSNTIRSYRGPKRDGINGSGKKAKEYKELWNYYSYYPVDLPLRRPYSGNPKLLNEEEFGERSTNMSYDEDSVNSAKELGLMEEKRNEQMFFFQLPATLPLPKAVPTNEPGSSRKPPTPTVPRSSSLQELPPGFMGKLLVYKSGAVKLKLGDTLYDVSSGANCVFANNAVVINTDDKLYCEVGELQRAIITPNVDSILGSAEEMKLV